MQNSVGEEALSIEVFGRVQGVMFRQAVKDFCDKLNLKGSVMNKGNGSVFIAAQGVRGNLDEFLFWLRKNPGLSSVEGVAYCCAEVMPALEGFSILKEDSFFADKAKSVINLGKSLFGKFSGKVPMHVAIIPDGNRRWAREKGFEASKGHLVAGEFEHLKEIMNEARRQGVMYLSLWGFSTENWSRNKIERDTIFGMIEKMVPKLSEEFKKEGIKFRHIGRKDRLPRGLVSALTKLERETEKNKKFNVHLCLDYGGRDELIRAANKMIEFGVKKIDENSFKSFLDTQDIPDPDLIIRTSGEQRISGFMPFQATYAELYFSEPYFPDFGAREFGEAISSFGKRIRRFGGTAKEDIAEKK